MLCSLQLIINLLPGRIKFNDIYLSDWVKFNDIYLSNWVNKYAKLY